MGMNRKEKKNFIKSLKPIIKEFIKLEKKYTSVNVRYAMRRYLGQIAEEQKREKVIKRVERELAMLKEKRI